MMQRQLGDTNRMQCQHWKFKEAALFNRFHQVDRARLDLTQPRLDGDFPNRSRGHVNLLSCLHHAANARLQRGVSLDSPKEDVRIEQKAHQRPSKPASTSSGSGASKSAAIFSLPLRTPNLIRCFSPFANRVIRTNGFPLRLTITSSPAAALSTNCENRVFAS